MSNVNCLNPWDPQSKRQYGIDGCYATFQAMDCGGGRCDGIVYCIEGNVVDRASAKNGKGWCEDVSPTLNTQDKHAVCFQLCGDRDDPSVSVSDTAYCIPANPMSDRGQAVCIALEGNGARPSHMGKGFSEDGTMYTLNTIEQHSVCYSMSQRQISMMVGEEMTASLVSTDYKEPQLVCYSVDCRNLRTNEEISGTLQAKENGGFSYNYLNPVLKENE